MKTTLYLIIVLIITSLNVFSQAIPKNILWEKNYGEKKTLQAIQAILPTADSAYIAAGYVSLKGKEQATIWKFDLKGNKVWERSLNEENRTLAKSITYSIKGGYVVVANSFKKEKSAETSDMLVIETNANGETVYKSTFTQAGDDLVSQIITTNDGGYLVIGTTDSKGSGKKDAFAIRFDKDFNKVWEKNYGGTNNDIASTIVEIPDVGYLIAGSSESAGNAGQEVWLVKIDYKGNVLAQKTIGTPFDDGANCMVYTADEGFCIGGYTYVKNGETLDKQMYILKVDKNLALQWGDKRTFGTVGDDQVCAMVQTFDKSFTILGYTNASKVKDKGKEDAWILRLGEYGNQEWEMFFGAKKNDKMNCLIPSIDGGYLLAGYTDSKGESKQDLWLLKLQDDKAKEKGKTVEFFQNEMIFGKREFFIAGESSRKFVKFDYQTAFIDYFPEVEKYVVSKMETWAKKDRYETSENYSKRITLENSIKQEEKFTQEAINQYAPKQIKFEGVVKISGSYNPDNETFKLIIPNVEPIAIHVPVTQAREFENAWGGYRFQEVRFGLYNKKFVVANATLIVNDKLYAFDARKTTEYGKDMQLTVNAYDEKQLRIARVYTEIIKSVRDSLIKWDGKNEFETQQQFAERTTAANRKKAEETFTQKVLQVFAPKQIRLDGLILGAYNDETQCFPIEIPNSEPLTLAVPMNKQGDKFQNPKRFKERWANYQLKNVRYGIYDYKYVIASATISVSDTLSYTYDAIENSDYGRQMQTTIHLEDVDYGVLDTYTYASLFPEQQKKTEPPALVISNLTFTDVDKNNQIDANEDCKISFTLINSGKGKAYRLNLKTFEMNGLKGLNFEKSKTLGDLEAGQKIDVSVPISATMDLEAGKALFKIRVTEGNRNNPDEQELSLMSNRFVEPKIVLADSYFTSEGGGKIDLGKTIYLKAVIQNLGKGIAKNVKVKFMNPNTNILSSKTEFEVGTLMKDEKRTVAYEFLVSKEYTDSEVPIQLIISEQTGKYGEARTVKTSTNEELMPFTKYEIASDVDTDIPKNDSVFQNRFAIVIGNEEYSKYQEKLGTESNVEFAAADAITFSKYAQQIFGIPKENMRFRVNARKHEMNKMITEIVQLASTYSAGNAELFVFYAGHGFPNEQTQEAFIMPVDISGADVANGIKLAELYTQLTNSPNIKKATVFIDACFSGGGRQEGLLAARTVKVKPKESQMQKGSLVVFSASSGDQTALPYKEMNHGLFSYALLKKLKDSKGYISYGYLDDFIVRFVEEKSRRVNNKEQNPVVNTSSEALDTWKTWKIR